MERARRMAELAQAEQQAEMLGLQGEALITEIRMVLDPLLVSDFVDQDVPKAAKLMGELATMWHKAKAAGERISRLREALG